MLLDDSFISDVLIYNEMRESYRALVGEMFRQEVYAEDNSEKSKIPYTVIEANYAVELV